MERQNIKTCPECGNDFSAEMTNCPKDNTLLLYDAKKRADPLIGRDIDNRFIIKSLLGEGGWGTVYKAEQKSMHRDVALKVLKSDLCRDVILAKRFLREAWASSRLKHPNTITVHDFGQTEDGILYLAMELLEGKPLADVLGKEKVLSLKRAVNIVSQVCDSLTEAHKQGIIHRDLKPENIFLVTGLGKEDFVKVLDFGIAKVTEMTNTTALTATGSIFGTPIYMSPEQAIGAAVDVTTDLYALGVTFYEMLCGRPPFVGPTLLSILNKHVNDLPPPMTEFTKQFPEFKSFEEIVARVLDKNQQNRPRSAEEFKNLLSKAVEHVDITRISDIKYERRTLEQINTSVLQKIEDTTAIDHDSEPEKKITYVPEYSEEDQPAELIKAWHQKKKIQYIFGGILILAVILIGTSIIMKNLAVNTKEVNTEMLIDKSSADSDINKKPEAEQVKSITDDIKITPAETKNPLEKKSSVSPEALKSSETEVDNIEEKTMKKKKIVKKEKLTTDKQNKKKPEKHETVEPKKIENEFKNLDTDSEFKNL